MSSNAATHPSIPYAKRFDGDTRKGRKDTRIGPPPADGLDLWCVPLEELLDDPTRSIAESVLSHTERARAREIRTHQGRCHFVASRALVRSCLSARRPEVEPGAWKLRASRFGRRFVAGPDPRTGPWFSVSHTRDLVLCAVGEGPHLGIDAERLDRRASFREITRHFFAPGEREALERAPAWRQGREFLARWTVKEAFSKAKGRGLSLPLDCIEVDLPDGRTPRLVRIGPPLRERLERWEVRLSWLASGHVVALVGAAGSLDPLRWHFTAPGDLGARGR